jgi:ATP-binding cassette subfamily B protein
VYVSWQLALLITVAIIPGLVVQFRLSRRQIKHWNQNVEIRRTLNMVEWNMLQPRFIGELRLYGVVDYLLRLRARLRDKDEKARVNIERQNIPLVILSDMLESVAQVGALIWVSLQVIAHAQPLGQFVYVQQMVSRAIGSASRLVSTLSSIDGDVANLFNQTADRPVPAQQGHTAGR